MVYLYVIELPGFKVVISQPLTLMRVPRQLSLPLRPVQRQLLGGIRPFTSLEIPSVGEIPAARCKRFVVCQRGERQKVMKEANLTTKTWCGHEGRLGSPMEQAPNLAQVGISSQSHFYESMIISSFINFHCNTMLFTVKTRRKKVLCC